MRIESVGGAVSGSRRLVIYQVLHFGSRTCEPGHCCSGKGVASRMVMVYSWAEEETTSRSSRDVEIGFYVRASDDILSKRWRRRAAYSDDWWRAIAAWWRALGSA